MSLTGLISGPSALLLLPFIGWITDRGSNPRRRKKAAMIFAAAVLFLGMSLLIVANLLHLSDLMRYSEMQGSPSDLLPLWNASAKSELLLHNETSPFNVSTIPNDSLGYENSILVSSSSSRNSESVPFTAVLSSEAAGNETGQNEPSKNPSEVSH